MTVFVDAKILIWAIFDRSRLSITAATVLADATNDLLVSEATLWELLNKVGRNKLLIAGSDVIVVYQLIRLWASRSYPSTVGTSCKARRSRTITVTPSIASSSRKPCSSPHPFSQQIPPSRNTLSKRFGRRAAEAAARIQAGVQEAHDAEERELEAMRMEGEQEELAAE